MSKLTHYYLMICVWPQVSGAGDGLVRTWAVTKSADGRFSELCQIGAFGVRGYVNGLHISRDGQVVVAGVGQEPRCGRWAVDKNAKNGVHSFRTTTDV